MIVLMGGMPRSGSTFAFNIARELMRARAPTHQEATDDVMGALERSGSATHLLIKAHTAGPPLIGLALHGAVRTVITVRRVEDAAASWMETFGWSDVETVNHLREWIALYARLRDVALIVPYAQVERRPGWAAWRIARHLFPDAGMREVAGIVRRYSKARVKAHVDSLTPNGEGVRNIGFSYYDEETFFHRRHVSSLKPRPAGQRVDPERLAYVLTSLAPDLEAAGLSRPLMPKAPKPDARPGVRKLA